MPAVSLNYKKVQGEQMRNAHSGIMANLKNQTFRPDSNNQENKLFSSPPEPDSPPFALEKNRKKTTGHHKPQTLSLIEWNSSTKRNYYQTHKKERAARPLTPLLPLADESPIRIHANWRWMFGAFLTGIAGIILISSVIYLTFDGQLQLEVRPHAASGKPRNSPDGYLSATPAATPASTTSRKSDFANEEPTDTIARHVMQKSMITTINGQEFIEVKPHIHIAANLVMNKSEHTDNLPPFDPLKLLYKIESPDTQEPPRQIPARSNGVIVVTLANMPLNNSFFQDTQRLDYNETSAMLHTAMAEKIAAPGISPIHYQTITHDKNSLFSSNFSNMFAPVTHNNITALEKRPAAIITNDNLQKTLTIKGKQTLTDLLLTSGGSNEQEAQAIATAMSSVFSPKQLQEGDIIRIEFSESPENDRFYPIRISAFKGTKHLATVGLIEDVNKGRQFAAFDDATALVEPQDNAGREMKTASSVSLYRSLFETGRRNGIPDDILLQMVRIHAYDVDFKHPAQSGDAFEVFYVADDAEGNISSKAMILYSAIVVDGEIKRFYRFRSPDDGRVDYYDRTGKSAKTFLIRKPINGGVLRSGFGMRKHPILGSKRMHTGVDWAARTGTPIVAASDGVVEKAQRMRGYGNYTLIRHANGYKSAYAHQARFAKGLKKGMKVKQGQVIGYVGSTGLSTGPHLHYEVILNGRFVNPMRLRMPRGRILQGDMKEAFKKEKKRIIDMMEQSPAAMQIAKTTNTDKG